MWLVISNKGATHLVPIELAQTAERALEVHYEAMEHVTGLKRENMIQVIGVLNIQSKNHMDLKIGLNSHGLKLEVK